ncbi:hypothetical protein [Streptomyces sp. ISL-100]|uniref:hypothetical protein n=1 Tax=Streptomyces sp. ISL-100 TaxID=2819173 RepID=UPI001BE81F09|nr:hypothetical protein [Streptomyces sp. ISL-100]MBT2398762.1 hypothetical protein [Streptomyces sp. ISL-100]
MTVAPATRSAPRSRSRAAGPWRTWVLAALLLTLMYTHGVSAESAAGHAHLGAPTNAVALNVQAPVSAEYDHDAPGSHSHQRHTDDHEAPAPQHAAHECVSGQPVQAAALSAPCEAQAIRPPYAYVPAAARSAVADWSSPLLPDSAVLRI